MSREDRKEQITRERQAQIMEAALGVFSRDGFSGATMPDIAREAGVAVGTIYNYYKNKRDLLVAITNKYVIEPFTDIVRQPPAGGDAALISSLIENRLSFGTKGAARFLPLLMEVQRDPELKRSYTEKVLKPVMGMMEQYVAARMKDGTYRNIDPALVTRIVGGMVIGFMLLYHIEGEGSPAHAVGSRELADQIAGFILNGLRPR